MKVHIIKGYYGNQHWIESVHSTYEAAKARENDRMQQYFIDPLWAIQP